MGGSTQWKRRPNKQWIKYALSAVLYSIAIVLYFTLLKELSPAIVNLLANAKILFVSLFLYLLLGTTLSKQQCLAIGTVLTGAVFLQWTELHLSSDVLTILILQMICTCFASAWLEYCMKSDPCSFQEQCFKLYSFGVPLYFLLSFVFEKNLPPFDPICLVLVVLYGLQGIVIGAIMKFHSNIVRCLIGNVNIITTMWIGHLVGLDHTVLSDRFILGSIAILVGSGFYIQNKE
jgi:drug/metabolite transporter (DMT)-like permease